MRRRISGAAGPVTGRGPGRAGNSEAALAGSVHTQAGSRAAPGFVGTVTRDARPRLAMLAASGPGAQAAVPCGRRRPRPRRQAASPRRRVRPGLLNLNRGLQLAAEEKDSMTVENHEGFEDLIRETSFRHLEHGGIFSEAGVTNGDDDNSDPWFQFLPEYNHKGECSNGMENMAIHPPDGRREHHEAENSNAIENFAPFPPVCHSDLAPRRENHSIEHLNGTFHPSDSEPKHPFNEIGHSNGIEERQEHDDSEVLNGSELFTSSHPSECGRGCTPIHRQRFEWQRDNTINNFVAKILVAGELNGTPVFPSCPDYGTLSKMAVFQDELAERALFVVATQPELDRRGLSVLLDKILPKDNFEPYRPNFPGQSSSPGICSLDFRGESVRLMRRVCTWRGKPPDFEPR